MLIILLLVVLPLVNTFTSNINTTTVTAITIKPKGMKVIISRELLKREDKLNLKMPCVCRLSKSYNINILGTVWDVEVETNRACCEGC